MTRWIAAVLIALCGAPALAGPGRLAEQVAVVGAGSYGTALAAQLSRNGHRVVLWARERQVVSGIRRHHENPLFLPGIRLPNRVTASSSLRRVVEGKKLVVVAVPSKYLADVTRAMSPYLSPDATVVSAAKGIRKDGRQLKTMTKLLAKELDGRVKPSNLAVLSGPSFAKEIGQRKPTVVTVAAEDRAVAAKVGKMFSGRRFAVQLSSDVRGVQFWGAAKNPLAIVAGLLDGMGADRHTRKAVLGNAIAELGQLASAYGAKAESFTSAAGLGDIVLTASVGSRNYRLGQQLGKGKSLQQILQKMNGQVAEGEGATRSILGLAKQHELDLPTFKTLDAVIAGKQPPRVLLKAKAKGSTRPGIWRSGAKVIEAVAGYGAGRGWTFNPKAKLTTEVAQEIASLAQRSRRGKGLLEAPHLAASVMLTNGSAASADYKLGQKLGSKAACNGRSVDALRCRVQRLLDRGDAAGVDMPALRSFSDQARLCRR